MQSSRSDVMSRLGGAFQKNIRRTPRVEYVNRAGEQVNPRNGKPYNRPAAGLTLGAVNSTSNGNVQRKKKRGRIKIKMARLALPVKTFGIMFGGLTPIDTNPTIDPPPRVCYNCWQPGHARKNCPRPEVAKICNNCGRRGEDLTSCPRCKDAHTKYLSHLRGESLEAEDFNMIFPFGDNFAKNNENMPHGEEGMMNDDCDEVIRQLIGEDNRQMSNYDEQREYEREPMYREPEVKYVETREYVKNPVSRYHQSHNSEDNEELRHRYHDDYDYDRIEGSYDERDREEYYRQREREHSEDRSSDNARRGNSNHVDADSDPVQDILQLAKSIAHLSSETQEMIMKQVMAERQEKARLRAMQQRNEEDWP